ncbi:MAG: flavohemoglobin expression-modulating QEGLA motif protein [Oligoflexia bacterium]|nr:flavohemoglobin expression-modulating QEGLA motif protein [Oligoflexia bacterium]
MKNPKPAAALKHFAELDSKLVEVAKNIKVLRNLTWPASIATSFLEKWSAGSSSYPLIEYPKHSYKNEVAALKMIMEAAGTDHPLGRYIYKTARSYMTAALMLEYVGTPAFTELSAEIYGSPRDKVWSTSISNLEASEHFISSTEDFRKACPVQKEESCLMATYVAAELQKAITPFFHKHKVEVVVDPELASKAAAAANRIRIRNFTCFSQMDIPQLLHHEAFVHTLTMLNGKEQPYLKSMSLGAPRTTRTQEGLALFAEFITTSIDINRLRRIALRVKAIDMAMQGADFIEIFKFFMDSDQGEVESFQSAARIFRGGDVRGRSVFTKDSVYLEGLMYIHSFLHKAIHSGKIDYPHRLMAGRLTFSDVVELEEFFDSGFIAPPLYEPTWITQRECLTAFLSYSVFSHRIDLNAVELKDFKLHDRISD